jgi:hypothetical protein
VDAVQIVSVVSGSVGALTALLNLGPDPRRRVKRDLELAAMFPDGSNARSMLIAEAENRVAAIIERERWHTRDWNGVAAAIVLLGFAGLLFWGASSTENVWLRSVLATVGGILAAIGMYGFIESIIRRRRGQQAAS